MLYQRAEGKPSGNRWDARERILGSYMEQVETLIERVEKLDPNKPLPHQSLIKGTLTEDEIKSYLVFLNQQLSRVESDRKSFDNELLTETDSQLIEHQDSTFRKAKNYYFSYLGSALVFYEKLVRSYESKTA